MIIRLVGAAIFVIAAYYTWVGSAYTARFGDVLGPAIFPVIVGIPTMLLSASLVLFPGGQVALPDKRHMLKQVLALVILVGYAWLLKPLGFPLATFGLITLLGLVLGGEPLKSVMLGGGTALGLWALFDQVLGLPLAFLGTLFN